MEGGVENETKRHEVKRTRMCRLKRSRGRTNSTKEYLCGRRRPHYSNKQFSVPFVLTQFPKRQNLSRTPPAAPPPKVMVAPQTHLKTPTE